ncbi:hypothetical protein H5410_005174, partial [Solanum commersonii]
MTNSSSSKKKSKKKVHATTSKDSKTLQKRVIVYVAAFAEYLSDEINIPSISFQSDYFRNRYATLLWKYGMNKFKAGYVSDNDDPTRPKSFYTIPAE